VDELEEGNGARAKESAEWGGSIKSWVFWGVGGGAGLRRRTGGLKSRR